MMDIELAKKVELAKKILRDGLGKAELEMVTSFTAPLFWTMRERGGLRVKNGSTFFLNVGAGPFAVTAAHVIAGWREDRAQRGAGSAQLARGDRLSLPIDFEQRLIDEDRDIDIATFRVSAEEVASLGKTILTGAQKSWPPGPPELERGVLLAGYPGRATLVLKRNELSFGAAPAGLIAHSVSEIDISSMLEHDHLMAVLGRGLPPENFDFGGISGGPMLTIVEKPIAGERSLRSHALAGVIYQGPNTAADEAQAIMGLEIIKARRAHFIKSDGTLDRNRWRAANIR